MGEKDLTIASTTDSEAEIKAAMTRSDEAPVVEAKHVETPETPGAKEPDAEETPAVEAVAEKDEKPAAAAAGGDEPEDAELGTRVQKRIRKLTWEREEEKRRADRLQQQLDAAKPAPVAQKVEEPPKPVAKDQAVVAAEAETAARAKLGAEPDAEKFETHEEWLKELSAYNRKLTTEVAATVARQAVHEAIQTQEAKAAEAKATEEFQQQHAEFMGRKAEVLTRHPDFDDVLKANATMELGGVVQHVIYTSEVGHDIAYHLMTHPDEAADLNRLVGSDAIRAMGRLEERIAKQVGSVAPEDQDDAGGEEPKPKVAPVVPSARAVVVKPVGGRAATNHVPDDQLSYQAFKTKRDQEELARKRARR